jgi:hypothetical protein
MSGVCRICGCSEFMPCVDEVTGEACAWANAECDLCTFCAEFAAAAKAAFMEGYMEPGEDEPLVVPATEHEAQRFIEGTRAARAGGGR